MNSQLIIDLMHQQLLPRILRQDFSLLPSADREVPYSKSYQPIVPYPIHSHIFFGMGLVFRKTYSSAGKMVQRHFDGANVAYVDGHVKCSKLPGILTKDNTMWDLNYYFVTIHPC